MPVVIANIVGAEGPKSGKKRGRIKDTNGILYQITPELARTMGVKFRSSDGVWILPESNPPYSVEYTDEVFMSGTNELKYKVVQSIVPAMPGQTVPTAPPSMPNKPPITPPQTYVPAPQPNIKDEDIATLAIAKPQLEKINPGDRVTALHILRESALAWRDFKKWQKLGPQTVAEDMDDGLPPEWEKQ